MTSTQGSKAFGRTPNPKQRTAWRNAPLKRLYVCGSCSLHAIFMETRVHVQPKISGGSKGEAASFMLEQTQKGFGSSGLGMEEHEVSPYSQYKGCQTGIQMKQIGAGLLFSCVSSLSARGAA